MKKKNFLLRSVPLERFNDLFDVLEKIIGKTTYRIYVQQDFERKILIRKEDSLRIIKNGKLNFFRGIIDLKFCACDLFIIPVNSFNMSENANILLYTCSVRALKYIIIYPDNSFVKYNLFDFYKMNAGLIFKMIIFKILKYMYLLYFFIRQKLKKTK